MWLTSFNFLGLSLDKIMELKNLANNNDLFDALKKQKRKEKQQNLKKKDSKSTEGPKTKSPSVFDFINKLRPTKGRFVIILTGSTRQYADASMLLYITLEVKTISAKICEVFAVTMYCMSLYYTNVVCRYCLEIVLVCTNVSVKLY